MRRNFKVTFTKNAFKWKKNLTNLKKMEVLAIMNLIIELYLLAIAAQYNLTLNVTDVQEMYELSKRFFSKWSKKLQPQSIYIYKCLDIYFDACIELSMWDKITSIGSKMIKIHRYHLFIISAEPNWSLSRMLTS